MEVTTQFDNLVEVTVYRRIQTGMTLRINPSEAYLGIDSGVIKVQHITDLAGLLELDEDLSRQADAFGNAHLDMLGEDRELEKCVYQYAGIYKRSQISG